LSSFLLSLQTQKKDKDMGLLDGKVAFITGVARGQGRSHALTLGREGANIIGVDLCQKPSSIPYAGATAEDLEETVRLVEGVGAKIIAEQADVRDLRKMQAVFDAGIAQFGRVDIVLPNAGICAGGLTWEITPEDWQEMLDINLTGPWNTVRVAIPTMIKQGSGGSIVFTGSVDALKGSANISSYAAAKHGITGLMRSLANEVGQYGIRVNSINPGHVDTLMLGNHFVWRLFRPDLKDPTKDDVVDSFAGTNLLPQPWMEPQDVSNAILYLVSDAGRCVTGSTQLLDSGFLAKS
jgi:SDR family mycofactocin-dependent oxidoreductase